MMDKWKYTEIELETSAHVRNYRFTLIANKMSENYGLSKCYKDQEVPKLSEVLS